MNKLTKQDIFNKVWDVFVVQKVPFSYDNIEDQCVYRKEVNGYGCAIGLFIEDQELASCFDRIGISGHTIINNDADQIIFEYEIENDKYWGNRLDEFQVALEDFQNSFDKEDVHLLVFVDGIQNLHDAYSNINKTEEIRDLDFRTDLEKFAMLYNLEVPTQF